MESAARRLLFHTSSIVVSVRDEERPIIPIADSCLREYIHLNGRHCPEPRRISSRLRAKPRILTACISSEDLLMYALYPWSAPDSKGFFAHNRSDEYRTDCILSHGDPRPLGEAMLFYPIVRT